MKRIVSFREDPGLPTSSPVYGFADGLHITDSPVIEHPIQDRGAMGSVYAEGGEGSSRMLPGPKKTAALKAGGIEDRLGKLEAPVERRTE